MRQGEIWLINLDPSLGAEIQKTRPAVIVSDNSLGRLPLKVLTPVTDWKEHYAIAPWMIKLIPNINNNLLKISAVDTFQIRSVSELRFIKKIGFISSQELEAIKIGLAKILSIPI